MATTRPRPGDAPPSTFTLQHSSPLDTLVRRTSGRERRNEFKRPVPLQQQQHQQSTPKPSSDTPRSRSALGNATTAAAAAAIAESSSQGTSALTVDTGLASAAGRSLRPAAPSPLLHSNFRNSTATTIDDDSSSQRTSRIEDYDQYPTRTRTRMMRDTMAQEIEYDDDRSVYSLPSAPPWQASHPSSTAQSSPAPAPPQQRDSWTSEFDYYTSNNHDTHRDTGMTYGSSVLAAPYASSGEMMSPGLPTVVVSDYDAGSTGAYGPAASRVAKTPVVQTTAGITNFSRPMRPPVLPAWENKQKVLERNHSRRGQQQQQNGDGGDGSSSSRPISPLSNQGPQQYQPYQAQSPPPDATAPLGRRSPGIRSVHHDSSIRSPSPHAAPDYPLPAPPPSHSHSSQPSTPAINARLAPNNHHHHPRSLSPGSSASASTSSSSLSSSSSTTLAGTIAGVPNPSSSAPSLAAYSHAQHPYSSSSPSPSSSSSLSPNASQTTMSPNLNPNYNPSSSSSPQILLPRKPEPPTLRAASPSSVYSGYSYYQLPASPNHSDGTSTPTNGGNSAGVYLRASPSGGGSGSDPSTPTSPAEYYLQLGIQHHEANRLEEAAAYFERSAMGDVPPGSSAAAAAATGKGGNGVGMLMWGLTLRHGWGVPKDEKAAFKWLRRAAEMATDDLEVTRQRGGAEVNLLQVCSFSFLE
jgi:TPR repeat protein